MENEVLQSYSIVHIEQVVAVCIS